jgi:hypothetical protein
MRNKLAAILFIVSAASVSLMLRRELPAQPVGAPAGSIRTVTALPATCTTGQVAVLTTGGSPGLYTCTSTNTWTFAGGAQAITGTSLTLGASSAQSGYVTFNGATSGNAGFAVPNAAGSSILYLLPTSTGTAGPFMQDTGAATCPTLPAGAPSTCHQMAWTTGVVWLSTQTAASSAELDFTLPSNFDEFMIDFADFVPATGTAELWLQVSLNGGSSYVTSSSYAWAELVMQTTGSTGSYGGAVAAANGSPDTMMKILNNSGGYATGTLRMYNPSGSQAHKLVGGVMHVSGTVWLVHAQYDATSSVNAFRIKMGTGNITSGSVRLYGVGH